MNGESTTRLRLLGTAIAAFLVLLTLIGMLAAANATVQGNAPRLDLLPPSEEDISIGFSSDRADDWIQLSGNWDIVLNNTVEYEQQTVDAINATAYYTHWVESDYRFRVDIRRTGGSGSYGIAFNIDPDGGLSPYLARFNDSAGEIQWGHLMDDGQFLRQGGYVPPGDWKPSTVRTLAVDVAGDHYTVLLLNKQQDRDPDIIFESQTGSVSTIGPGSNWRSYRSKQQLHFKTPGCMSVFAQRQTYPQRRLFQHR